MNEAIAPNINIAVFRGGKSNHLSSMQSGKNAINILTKNGINVNDVYLDEEGNFIKNGVSSDKHNILVDLDAYIDTTDLYNHSYHDLAGKMGLKNFFSYKKALPIEINREDVYRILRQSGIKVPDTFLIRKGEEDLVKTAKEVWVKFHTPFLVRPIEYHAVNSSSLVKSFQDLIEAVKKYHDSGNDVQIISYKSVPTFATAVIPNYRGEEYYTPLSVKTFVNKHEVPSKDFMKRIYLTGTEDEKEKIKNIVKDVSKALQIQEPVCIDVIPYKKDFVVVNVDLSPSLNEDSRFMQSLSSTGVNIGHYIKEKLDNNL